MSSATSHPARAKQTVTFTWDKSGTQPPVFVAGSFAAWEPFEMESTRKDNGDLVFTRTFDAIEEGVYEYKFRLGVGDWWVTDETSEIIVDEAGFVNNILRVKPAPVEESTPEAAPIKKSSPKAATSVPVPSDDDTKSTAPSADVHDSIVETSEATPAGPTAGIAAAAEPSSDVSAGAGPMPDIPSAAKEADSITEEDDIPRMDDAEDDLDIKPVRPATPISERGPLFHHETFYESDQMPLLPHEIGSLENSPVLVARQQPQSPRTPVLLSPIGARLEEQDSPAFPEPDLNDPSLERIDTTQEGIIQQIRRLSQHDSGDGAPLRPSHNSHSSMDAIDEEEDDAFDEGVPMHSPKDKKSVLEDFAHPQRPQPERDLPSSLDGAPDHADVPSAVRRKPFATTTANGSDVLANPRALPTPPMTPREHSSESGAEAQSEPPKAQSPAKQQQQRSQQQEPRAFSPVTVIVGGALALFCCNFVLHWFR